MLAFLKYAGLLVAAVSGVLGIVAEAKRRARGKQELTLAGYVLIALTFLGLLISVVSGIEEDRQASLAVRDQLTRTNQIIVAGQPLISLEMRWQFRDVSEAVLDRMRLADEDLNQVVIHHQGELAEVEDFEINRVFKLHPFLAVLTYDLARDKERIKSILAEREKVDRDANSPPPPLEDILALISLDENHNSVLPIGSISSYLERAAGDNPWQTEVMQKQKLATFAAGVFGGKSRDADKWPTLDNLVAKGFSPVFEMGWRLDPRTFDNSIDRQNAKVIPSAKLPVVLKVAVLFDIKDLPIEPGNLASLDTDSVWDTDPESSSGKAKEDLLAGTGLRSYIKLVSNSLPEATYIYRLKSVHRQELVRREDETQEFDIHCMVFEFEQLTKAEELESAVVARPPGSTLR